MLLLTTTLSFAQTFTATDIPDSVFSRMQGRSYPEGCTVPRSCLRYLRLSHWDFNGKEQVGEMVCNQEIADDLVAIFKKLYQAHYPIERMQLIDDFEANDEQSMRANNTSCFCYRQVAGHKTLSRHALGMAVDINPLYNPCVRTIQGRQSVQPSTAEKYADRKKSFPHKITKSTLPYRLFVSHGFQWGGAWRTVKDYQHFEKKALLE